MIYFEQAGRLGNQFFRYAVARAYDIERGEKDKLVVGISRYEKEGKANNNFDQLSNFNIKKVEIADKDAIDLYSPSVRFVYRLLFLIGRLTGIKGKRFEKLTWKLFSRIGIQLDHYGTYPFKCPQTKDVFLDGDFQNPYLFSHIKKTLVNEFTPKNEPLDKNSWFYNLISQATTVCVHVRRGDFLSDQYRKDFYVCDDAYYKKAIALIEQKVENPVFVFFSNDIDWVRENIKVNAPCYYEPKDNPLWESFRMMYSCKHFIISNSTMSWWAQYLGRYDRKIVISPDHWFNNPEMLNIARLIMPEFVTIQCPWHN